MKNLTLTMTIGAPSSGKTSWAEEFCKNNPDYQNINRDDIRQMITGQNKSQYKFKKYVENMTTRLQFEMAGYAIDHGKHVIISDTNLNPKTREKWYEFAKVMGVEVLTKNFEEPVHVLLKRNLERAESVPENVIIDMAKKMREYLGKPFYSFEEAHKNGLSKAVVFDIDGTLAHIVDRGPYDSDKYMNDKVDDYLVKVLLDHVSKGYTIIILTGREADETGKQTLTEQWLKHNAIPYDEIFCRAYKDHRCDAIIKEELFFSCVADKYAVECIYDDRDQVVHMWRNIGVRCLQVADGKF